MLALLAVGLRRKIIPKMETLGAQIQSNEMDAIRLRATMSTA